MTRFTVYDPQRHHNKALDIVPHKWRSSAGWNTTPINVTDRAEGAEKTTGQTTISVTGHPRNHANKLRASREPARAQTKYP